MQAASVIGFITPSNSNAYGFAVQVNSEEAKDVTIKFRIVVSEKDVQFCTHPETHLSTATVTKNSQSVSQVRKLDFKRKEGTIVCTFSVKRKQLEDPEFCFVFSNFSETHANGKVVAMPSVSFVCVQLKDFINLAVPKAL